MHNEKEALKNPHVLLLLILPIQLDIKLAFYCILKLKDCVQILSNAMHQRKCLDRSSFPVD